MSINNFFIHFLIFFCVGYGIFMKNVVLQISNELKCLFSLKKIDLNVYLSNLIYFVQ
jgi:hypothetical protein